MWLKFSVNCHDPQRMNPSVSNIDLKLSKFNGQIAIEFTEHISGTQKTKVSSRLLVVRLQSKCQLCT